MSHATSGQDARRRGLRRRRRWPVCLLAAALSGGVLAAAPGPASAVEPERGVLDATGRAGAPHARVPQRVRRARAQLRRGLGTQGLVAVDDETGEARAVAKLDGLLTPESARGAGEIARDYVRSHAAVFGLDAQDLDALRLVRRYTSRSGIEHVVWAQTYKGIPSVDSVLRASLTATGRLINVLGPAQPDLSVPSTTPKLSAAQAAAAAARATGARPRGASGSEQLVIYRAETGNRLAWRVITAASSTEVYDSVVDATTGDVVRRVNRVNFAQALVHDHYPGAPLGGSASVRTIPAAWLDSASRLHGPYAHAFSDVDDLVPGASGTNVTPRSQDEVGPSGGGNWNYSRTTFSPPDGNCPGAGCAWDHTAPSSWSANRQQATTQLFWFVNTFRDHLAAAPIGFTAASGGFEGNDRVLAQSNDGANTGTGPQAGLPDADHVNNAGMITLADGTPGLMQMYLWQPEPGLQFRAVNGADDATIVYHEYAHGLSNRLVTDAQGFGALWTTQAAAMGEGWSDWYAMDFLAAQGFVNDTATQGEVEVGDHPDTPTSPLRVEALDCAVGPPPAAATRCSGTNGSGVNGYTYGDFGNILGIPEVHADGEIWGQTLWQLRQALIAAQPATPQGEAEGIRRARLYITEAMRLSPPYPTFLDMRNAILQAETIDPSGNDRGLVWGVFASRGMGYFASTHGANDAAPVESFATPPAAGGPTGTVQGHVHDDAGAPHSGARVAFAGHDTGLGQDLSAVSGADGAYAIGGVPAGRYPLLYVQPTAPGFVREEAGPVDVAPSANTRNWVVRRNLASPALGAAVASFTGPDLTQVGCGPGALVDGDQITPWASDSPRGTTGGEKQIVIRLARAADVESVRIDPAAGCGDSAYSSLGRYAVDVSRSAADPPPADSFAQVAAGTFTFTDNGRLNALSLAGSLASVTYVRLRAIDTQSAGFQDPTIDNGFMDVAEMQVLGRFTPQEPPPPPPPEQPPPAVATGPAKAITRNGARLTGTVDPNGSATTYHFEYGTTAAYGKRTAAVSAGAGDAPVAVDVPVTGLAAATAYHYRLVASNAKTAAGSDASFRTLRPPPLTILAPKTIRVPSSGRFSFRVRYTRDVRKRPSARVTVAAPKRIASAALRVAAGRTVTAKVRLSRSGRSLLRRKRRLSATLRVAVTTRAGRRVTVTKRVVLRPRRT